MCISPYCLLLLSVASELFQRLVYETQASLLNDPGFTTLAGATSPSHHLLRDTPNLCRAEASANIWERSAESRAQHFTDLGSDALQLGRLHLAEECMREAAMQMPSSFTAWTNLALLLRRQGKISSARDALLRAAALNPADHETWFSLGAMEVNEFQQPERSAPHFRWHLMIVQLGWPMQTYCTI